MLSLSNFHFFYVVETGWFLERDIYGSSAALRRVGAAARSRDVRRQCDCVRASLMVRAWRLLLVAYRCPLIGTATQNGQDLKLGSLAMERAATVARRRICHSTGASWVRWLFRV